jgi:glycosyltransferase involved in cell wall biosynthesis
MDVLLIHEHGRAHGSGGVVATYRLHRALQKAGVKSTLACRRRAIDAPDFVELPKAEFIERWLGKLTWRLGLNDIHCVSSFKIPKFAPFAEADVVNIHGPHTNFFNYLAIPRLARAKPVVLTLHDMWSFTGHCGYSMDCQRFKTGCGRCPYPDNFPPIGRDATSIEWKLKNYVYQRSDLTVVAPSKWIIELAQQSMLGRFPIHQIPNAVDTTVYQPIDKRVCRTTLGIDPNKLVVGFAAFSLADHIKGGDLLVEALVGLADELKSQLVLLTFGGSGEGITQTTGIETVSLGFLYDDEPKVQAYSAADVFVVPSRFENQGLVPIECISCGTPVVAFAVGGLPEVVRDGVSGTLAEPESAQSLRAKIAQVLTDPGLRQTLAQKCRTLAVDEFDISLHAKRYIDLYEQLISTRAAA